MIWQDELIIGKVVDEFTFQKLHQLIGVFTHKWLSEREQPRVVIGYDTRFQADLCGRICAAVLASYGVQVFLTKDPLPIGGLLFAAKKKEAHGLLITAGEKGIEYNGLRFIRPNGEGLTEREWASWEEELVHFPFIENLDFSEAVSEGKISFQPILDQYIDFLRQTIKRDRIEACGLRVVFDSLYGTSQGVFKQLLSARKDGICEIHDARHSMFGGLIPALKEYNLNYLFEVVRSEKRHLGFIYDPEAMHWCYLNGFNGQVISGHRMIPFIKKYLRLKGIREPFPNWQKDGIFSSLVLIQSIAES